jgi:DNA modification methylase
MLAAKCPLIIWGGNYFADLLPPSKAWLYWDKLMGGDFADGELAWTNLNRALRKFTRCNKDHGKEHPTQKPVALMAWCLGFLPDARTILDPFMGSGTTGIACVNLGRKFIGIEREERYFDIACKRIAEAYKQPRLFEEPQPKPVQAVLL